MNLVELYQKTPAERHADIKVIGDRVLVKTAEGGVEEYLLGNDGELWLVRSDGEEKERLAQIEQDVKAIKSKLGIA